MAQVTIEVSDTLAERLAGLPTDKMNRRAVAALEEFVDEEAKDAVPPLPAILMAPFADALRKSAADADAGRVVDGEAFFAGLQHHIERK